MSHNAHIEEFEKCTPTDITDEACNGLFVFAAVVHWRGNHELFLVQRTSAT